MIRIREVEEIKNLNGYSEDLMEKVFEYLQMLEEQIFQIEKGEVEVYENADDVKSLLKYLKASRIDEDEGGEIMSPLEMLKAGVIFGVTLYKIIKTNK